MFVEALRQELVNLGNQQKSIEQMYHQCTGGILAIQNLLERLMKEEAELVKQRESKSGEVTSEDAQQSAEV